MTFLMNFWKNKPKDFDSKSKASEKSEKFSLSQKFKLNSIYNSCEDYEPMKTKLISDNFIEKQFEDLFSEEITNLSKLKKLAWNGIPLSFFFLLLIFKIYTILRIQRNFLANFTKLSTT